MPASAVAKWAKFGITGVAATLAAAALVPHMAGAATGGATLAGPEAQAQTAPEGADAAKLAAGRELFNSWSCGTCHALKDADGSGHVGPSLDGNPRLTEAFIIDRVTNGAGPMPAFGGQMTDEEIADLAAYIHHAAVK